AHDIVAPRRDKHFMVTNRKTGVLVLTHGSKLKRANWALFPIVRELRRRTGNDCIVPCFMELGRPDIPTAVRALIRRGCNHIHGYAMFLAAGRHLEESIPRILRDALREFPGVTFEIGPAMMNDPGLTDLVEQRLARLLSNHQEIA
ncbi:MAG: CbiX/SirB N-terminal domain-containing protein, partial [Verrucomicrobiae bacterium]|nr:CbiX/SirB N-terminal domain-containing protein [Verrucomicrobiae bacterium]